MIILICFLYCHARASDCTEALSQVKDWVQCQNSAQISSCASTDSAKVANRFSIDNDVAKKDTSPPPVTAKDLSKADAQNLTDLVRNRQALETQVSAAVNKALVEAQANPNSASSPSVNPQSLGANMTTGPQLPDKVAEWAKGQAKRKLQSELKDGVKAALSKDQIQELKNKLVEQLVAKLRINLAGSMLGIAAEEAGGAGMTGTAARALGRAAGSAAGGAVGVGLYLVGAVSNSTSTGCSELGQPAINTDKDNNCKPSIAINKNVLDFVSKTPDEQAQDIARPKVCDFYKKLRDKLYKQPKFTNLQCTKNHVTLSTQADDGSIRTQDILLNNSKEGSTPSVKQINVHGGGGFTGVIETNPDGSIKNFPDSQYIADEVRPMRLYINDAIQCCSTTDDSEHSSCMTNYNSGASGGDSSSRSPASVRAQRAQ